MDACDARGNAPMHMAARGGHAEAVRTLIEAGAKVRPHPTDPHGALKGHA